MPRSLTIIAIGGKHDSDLMAAIARYEERLKPHGGIVWQLLPYSKESDVAARRAESLAIMQKIDSSDFVVLLDERGLELTSEALSAKVETWAALPRRLVIIIGGAYGVDESVRQRADVVWSLSRLVFPHQLVRLIVVEQLYRGAMIRQNHPYHHQ